MPELSEEDREKAKALLAELRVKIDEAAAGDEALRFQMKRYIGKRLEFDERGTPTHRRRLKAAEAGESARALCIVRGAACRSVGRSCIGYGRLMGIRSRIRAWFVRAVMRMRRRWRSSGESLRAMSQNRDGHPASYVLPIAKDKDAMDGAPELRRGYGSGSMGRTFTLRESVVIDAPIERCFRLSTSIEVVGMTLGMRPVEGKLGGMILAGDQLSGEGGSLGCRRCMRL